MTNASIGTVHSYPENPRVFKALIAAKYNGLNISQSTNFIMGTTNKSDEFLDKFPLGKVPAFVSVTNVLILILG